MGTGKMTRRAAALLLALALAAGLFPAALAEQPAAPAPMDVDLIMAKNAIAGFGIQGADGKTMEPRRAPDMRGRGLPDETGVEPDYRGVVGYASLQGDWEVSRFNTFTQTPWQLPVYEEKGGEFKAAKDSIKHKTPVLVIDQQIREAKGHKFIGYLKVVRLDIHHIVWIDVTQFVTVPYWILGLEQAVQYGYCIAVYSNQSGIDPTDRKGTRGKLADDTRVLMCDPLFSLRYISPDKENNPLLGIIFRNGDTEGTYYRTFLFFNAEDLTLIY